MAHYAVFDGEDYLYSGYNATSLKEVKDDILGLCENGSTDAKALKKMSADELCRHQGWELHSQDAPYPFEKDDLIFEL